MVKKIILWLFAVVVLSSSDCAEHDTWETDEVVYLCLDKGSQIGSHFNPFHKDNFEVSTDYYITLQNVKTKKTFVYTTRDGKEYYQYQVGKRYRRTRLREDWDRR